MRARFDDLTPGGDGSWELVGPAGEIVARRPDEVRGALAEVEAAACRGRWAAGWIAYEAAPGLDPSLGVRPGGQLPLVWFGLFADRVTAAPLASPAPRPLAWEASATQDDHAAAVATIRQQIADGNTYQVNHTVRFRAAWDGDPDGHYARLVRAQRGGYHALVDAGDHLVLCASPELFLAWAVDGLTTKPMKGTSPRGRWCRDDLDRAEALAGSVKERAENVMIVDLLRNDLGRIAVTGSVRVPALWAVERFETVWQLTSTVTATPRPGVGLVDVLAATFPPGSVTGAPKRSTMGVIAAVEDSPRGVYCGAVGWVGPPGSADLAGGPRVRLAVAIRTVVVDVDAGTAEYGAGGGITWASEAAAEWAEVVTKTRVLGEERPDFCLLETMAWRPPDGLVHLSAHLDRLGGSAGYFRYPWDRSAAERALAAAVSHRLQPGRVRLTLDRTGALVVSVAPLEAGTAAPVVVAVDDQPVAPDDVFLYHKTTVRATYLAATARHPGADDVLLVNQRGEVTESTIANLAVRRGGRWWTPPHECGLLAGVERARLLADATLAERVITVADLAEADDLALISSVRGWRPAVLLTRPS